MTRRVLTGIKPTGTPHLGNLLGAFRPALRLADEGLDAMYFIADYHALTTVKDRAQLARYTHEVAATWLALGLDPERTLFYRQSDVPEIFELSWVLACFTSKGWLDRAHAYKSAMAAGDTEINMGLYTYPVLMAADILAFDSDLVPVGKDQDQHVEIARDIAQRVNHMVGHDVLRVPAARIEHDSAVVPGTDGRKMSKSYGNTIPLFATAAERKKIIGRIVTDSTPPEAPKDPATSTIFELYRAVATPAEAEALAARYRSGIGWGEAKQALADRLEQELAIPRARYQELIADPARLDGILAAGAEKARAYARGVLERVRVAIGISRPR
ncbi:MAG: tryptophan--tRNA ligase [Deltaproteobacteria bacterium]|nr:tryptophan--tRNA ligase [Deltaproteobacteria bacterium]MCW5803670.1 tryptophan--tRNA ligase [Deltaproteobacteria bacterium]